MDGFHASEPIADYRHRARPAGDAAARDGAASDRAAHDPAGSVADLVESEVIPRLLLTCRAKTSDRRPSPAHVETLARLALSRDPAAAGAQVNALRETGVALDALLNDLIAPAARKLGEFWHADSIDFVEVALAVARLTQIVRGLAAQVDRDLPASAPRALIGSPAVERHALGAVIVAQSFRAAGWRVTEAPGADADAFVAAAASEKLDLLGVSVCSERALSELGDTIARVRAAALNPRMLIAVGGPALMFDPEAPARTGADFSAADGREAVARAHALLSGGARTVTKT
jgi:methanogenic corrinoid protein MtbC1